MWEITVTDQTSTQPPADDRFADLRAAAEAEQLEIRQRIEADPGEYLETLMEDAAHRHLGEVQDIELDDGFDAWLEQVRDIAENEVIPAVEKDIDEIETPYSVQFEFDHTTGAWTAELAGHPQGAAASATAWLYSHDTLQQAHEALLAEKVHAGNEDDG